MRIVDDMNSKRLLNFLISYTKIALVLYTLLILVRVGIFFEVDSLAEKLTDPEFYVGSFGAFLGASIQDEPAAVLFTIVFLCCIGLCFMCSFFNIYQARSMIHHNISKGKVEGFSSPDDLRKERLLNTSSTREEDDDDEE